MYRAKDMCLVNGNMTLSIQQISLAFINIKNSFSWGIAAHLNPIDGTKIATLGNIFVTYIQFMAITIHWFNTYRQKLYSKAMTPITITPALHPLAISTFTIPAIGTP
jgi:hypothetical protein